MTDDNQALEIVKDSLVRRMRTMFSLYYDAVDTMSLEHAHHFFQEDAAPQVAQIVIDAVYAPPR